MLRDFACFLWALWKQWEVLLTGGTIMALVALWHWTSGKPVPPWAYWILVSITYLLAGFLAWRREWAENRKGLIQVSLRHIIGLTGGRTSAQSRSILRPFIGKRIEVAGELDDVERHPLLSYVRLMNDEHVPVTFGITPWRLRHFTPLPKGTRITVVGRIVDAGFKGITMSGCEVLAVAPPVISD